MRRHRPEGRPDRRFHGSAGEKVGSGLIKSGCKTIVCQRFKQSGMIWSLNGVKSLLPLRTLLVSNRLEEFFRYRKTS